MTAIILLWSFIILLYVVYGLHSWRKQIKKEKDFDKEKQDFEKWELDWWEKKIS